MLDKNAKNSAEIVRGKPFKQGHKKLGGVKKGYKSIKNELKEELQMLRKVKVGGIMSIQKIIIDKLIGKAINGDFKSIQLIFEYIEGKPKTSLDIDVKELPTPIYGGLSTRKTILSNKLPLRL